MAQLPVGNRYSAPKVTTSDRTEWLMPAGLLALCAIPMAAGTIRMLQIGTGAEITPENARLLAAPLPVVLHLGSSTVFCVLGAFQFSAGLRRRHPGWHRASGRMLVACGLVAALSALWLTLSLPTGVEAPARFDGSLVFATRLLVGSAMTVFLCLGLAAVLRRDIPSHRAWMMRGYALGLGAGTQVFTHLPWFLFPGVQGESTRALCMAAGWGINYALAEWLISHPTPTAHADNCRG
jgi:uncharacterized membrane protein